MSGWVIPSACPLPRSSYRAGGLTGVRTRCNRLQRRRFPRIAAAFCRSRNNRARPLARRRATRSEEHTSELQSLMRISYAVFCLKKKNKKTTKHTQEEHKPRKDEHNA